jgi:hypothetical protein
MLIEIIFEKNGNKIIYWNGRILIGISRIELFGDKEVSLEIELVTKQHK